VFPKWAWSRSREQFLHCGLRKFCHSKSSVDRWYTQLDRRRFVYDTYKTMKATRTRHGWVHMFTTHRPTLTFQLHNFDLFRTCRTALLRGNWQDFNWHDASRGPSAIAELLVLLRWIMLSSWIVSRNRLAIFRFSSPYKLWSGCLMAVAGAWAYKLRLDDSAAFLIVFIEVSIEDWTHCGNTCVTSPSPLLSLHLVECPAPVKPLWASDSESHQ